MAVARGGDGGIGNKAFKSSTNRAPRRTIPGSPGEEAWLTLEFRLPVDVAMVGLPNSGKSDLLVALTGGVATVAPYPLSTLDPAFGPLESPEGRLFLVVDLPGLGLDGLPRRDSHLEQLERARVIVHCVDASDPESPTERIARVRAGLKQFLPPGLTEIVVATHADEAEEGTGWADLAVDTDHRHGHRGPARPARRSAHLTPMAVLVAKLGSSTLVDGDGNLRDDILEARVRDLVRVRRQGHHPVLVTSGAIACGLGRLGIRERPSALPDLQAASAVGQGVLFQRYSQAFAPHDVVPAQVLLTSSDLAARASYLNARTTLRRLAEMGAVPVINENDTTATDELTFGDNDVLAAQVAILMGATWLVLLTDREGLYAEGPDGPVLLGDVPAETRPDDIRLAKMSGSGLGSGGIASKVAAASMATGGGVTCVIASGSDEGVIPGVASGHHVGTRFSPTARPEAAFKLWLRHAKPTLGRIVVDDGAAAALRERGTSLLAVGVVSSEGGFQAGDAVEVVSGPAGSLVGKGISAMSADELRLVAGLKSDAVRERVPDAAPQVIHRDEFVLADARGGDAPGGDRGLMGGS